MQYRYYEISLLFIFEQISVFLSCNFTFACLKDVIMVPLCVILLPLHAAASTIEHACIKLWHTQLRIVQHCSLPNTQRQ
jgi:hypothetical protein